MAFVLVLLAGPGLVFTGDEWTFLIHRHGLSAATLFAPHNEHLSTVPVLLYLALRGTVGLHSYLPYLATVSLANAAIGYCVFVMIRRRAGTRAAVVGCVLFLLMGRASENVFWAFQVGWDLALLGGLAAFLVIEDPAPLTPRRQLLLLILLLVCVGSSGSGLVLFGLACGRMLLRTRRPADLWSVAVPVLAYLAWFLTWGRPAVHASLALGGNLGYMVSGIGASLLGVIGLGPEWSTAAVAGGALVALALLGLGFRPTLRTWVAVLGLLGLFALLSAVRLRLGAGQASSNRYIYSGAVFLLMLATEVLVWARARKVWGRARLLAIAMAALLLVSNALAMGDALATRRAAAAKSIAALGTLQFFRGSPELDASLVPDPIGLPEVTAPVAASLFDSYGAPINVTSLEDWKRLRRDDADLIAGMLFARATEVRVTAATGGTCTGVLPPRGSPLGDGASMTVRASVPTELTVWLSVTGAAAQPVRELHLGDGEAATITAPSSIRRAGWVIVVTGAGDRLRECRGTAP